jgi:hypothetical protein
MLAANYTVNRAHLFTNICLGSSKFIRHIYRDPNKSLETSEYPEGKQIHVWLKPNSCLGLS